MARDVGLQVGVLSYRRPERHPPGGNLTPKRLDRRDFIRVAGGSIVAAGLLGACEDDSSQDPGLEPGARRSLFFTEEFDTPGDSWGSGWDNIRYASPLAVAGGRGIIPLEPPTPKAIGKKGKVVAAYMARPVLVTEKESSDTEVQVRVRIVGGVEGGVLVRAGFDSAYALLVAKGEALLCRYDVLDRTILQKKKLDEGDDEFRLTLIAEGDHISGIVEPLHGSKRGVSFEVLDDPPLEAGLVGVLANPIDVDGGRVEFRAFEAASVEEPRSPETRFLYAFTGAIVPDGDSYSARLTARTDLPSAVSFQVSQEAAGDDFAHVRDVEPSGDLGAAFAQIDALAPNTLYTWWPLVGNKRGPTISFKTPPGAGEGVRFAFASCTSGRVTEYPSFEQAAKLEPEFYLHAGDWGYADLCAVSHSPDQFQARWIRMLRAPSVAAMLSGTPLMFWQDDHDYAADNGWSATVKPFTVKAFDEIHANPSDDYFDVRWGDVHVWCLDCRLHATDPEGPDDAGKSRIGASQKAWLKRGMARSDAPVKVVASGMVFRNKPDDDPGWHNVYTTERDELLRFFSEQPGTVFILSGDSHGQRLIHHFEFGELYEINSSGTDFPGGGQGNNDPAHTLVNIDDRSGFALVELDADGPDRKVHVRCIANDDGSTLFQRAFSV
ncbi:MAG: alkaline phosphatase [Actinomycetota bacterium]|jgi:hypothetical protein|nr:alkaline phosphatase [Actinomycetota bacterium]